MRVESFNMQCPVGTKVKILPTEGCSESEKIITKTRSEAWLMCGTPVVLVEGKSGGWDIDCLEIIRGE